MTVLEEKFVLEYIQDMLATYKLRNGNELQGAKFHHNSSYDDAPLIVKHGILPIKDIVALGLKNYSEEFLKVAGDTESHVNGDSAISLSIKGLDDLRPDEWEYNPDNPLNVDFRIDSGIKAGRSSIHYGNEYLSHQAIHPDKIRSIDIRLLQLIQRKKQDEDVKDIVNKYNNLIEIAKQVVETKLDVPLRERTEDARLILDANMLADASKLTLKK